MIKRVFQAQRQVQVEYVLLQDGQISEYSLHVLIFSGCLKNKQITFYLRNCKAIQELYDSEVSKNRVLF
jgi:hypothetical protein